MEGPNPEQVDGCQHISKDPIHDIQVELPVDQYTGAHESGQLTSPYGLNRPCHFTWVEEKRTKCFECHKLARKLMKLSPIDIQLAKLSLDLPIIPHDNSYQVNQKGNIE